MLESNLSRAGSHDPTTIFKLWPSRPHLSFPSTSRLSHIITIYHIYIVIISSNAHSLIDLIEASKPRYLDSSIPPSKSSKVTTLTSRSLY